MNTAAKASRKARCGGIVVERMMAKLENRTTTKRLPEKDRDPDMPVGEMHKNVIPGGIKKRRHGKGTADFSVRLVFLPFSSVIFCPDISHSRCGFASVKIYQARRGAPRVGGVPSNLLYRSRCRLTY